MTDKTGGPAFPVKGVMHGDVLGGQLSHGMTLRDYAAIKAMAAMLSTDRGYRQSEETIARFSYAQADAMIAERSKGE